MDVSIQQNWSKICAIQGGQISTDEASLLATSSRCSNSVCVCSELTKEEVASTHCVSERDLKGPARMCPHPNSNSNHVQFGATRHFKSLEEDLNVQTQDAATRVLNLTRAESKQFMEKRLRDERNESRNKKQQHSTCTCTDVTLSRSNSTQHSNNTHHLDGTHHLDSTSGDSFVGGHSADQVGRVHVIAACSASRNGVEFALEQVCATNIDGNPQMQQQVTPVAVCNKDPLMLMACRLNHTLDKYDSDNFRDIYNRGPGARTNSPGSSSGKSSFRKAEFKNDNDNNDHTCGQIYVTNSGRRLSDAHQRVGSLRCACGSGFDSRECQHGYSDSSSSESSDDDDNESSYVCDISGAREDRSMSRSLYEFRKRVTGSLRRD